MAPEQNGRVFILFNVPLPVIGYPMGIVKVPRYGFPVVA
jgi:hypothetical protein